MFRAPRFSSPASRGNALVPVLVIVAALAVSALIFFFVTRPQMQRDRSPESGANVAQGATPVTPANPAPAAAPASAPVAPVPTPAPTPKPSAPAAPVQASNATAMPPPKTTREAGAEQLVNNFSSLLAQNDLAAAAKALTQDNPAQAPAVEAMLEKVVHGLGYHPSATDQPQIIGQEGSMLRLAVPLAPLKAGEPGVRLMLDLEQDETGAWKVAKVHLPKELQSALADFPSKTASGLPIPPPPGAAAAPAASGHPFIVVDQETDALVFANNFVNTLLKLKFVEARKFVNTEKVSPVKLAALCIVFEDGKYRLADSKPLVATVSTDNTSWVITRVWSESQKQQTEFGLEMEKTGSEWRISGVNLSKLLSDNAHATSAEGVPYTPLVQSPKGGDSIALYFEYGQATLHPRAQKQLDIVVGLLKASPNKKLTIGGFTDAHGTDEYNLGLSQRRAAAVKEYFLTHGVPQTQVVTSAFGKSLPLSPNENPDGSDNPEGRSHNRRAEILLDF